MGAQSELTGHFIFKKKLQYFRNADGNDPEDNKKKKLLIQKRKERIPATMSLGRQKGWDLEIGRAHV